MRLKFIDVHAHLYLMQGKEEEDEWRLKYSERYGIEKLIISVLGSWGKRSPLYFPDPVDFRSGNKRLHEFIRSYQGPLELYGYVTVNQAFLEDSLDELRRGVEKYGFVGLKLLAPFPCNDSSTFKLIEKAVDYDIPILIHTFHGRKSGITGQNPSDSTDVAFLSKNFPRAKIIMAHIGGGGDWEYALKAVRGTKVYVDISGSGCDKGMIEKAVRIVGVDRVLFGTDLNMGVGIAKLLDSNLTHEEKLKIAWNNAMAVFGGALK
ncbi:MAG TPA: hypothetical protein ENG58_01565 [Thermotogales bacterium]|nr:hypothetical protein [Thermotogales bacterium]